VSNPRPRKQAHLRIPSTWTTGVRAFCSSSGPERRSNRVVMPRDRRSCAPAVVILEVRRSERWGCDERWVARRSCESWSDNHRDLGSYGRPRREQRGESVSVIVGKQWGSITEMVSKEHRCVQVIAAAIWALVLQLYL
jgi:hypothetical protein